MNRPLRSVTDRTPSRGRYTDHPHAICLSIRTQLQAFDQHGTLRHSRGVPFAILVHGIAVRGLPQCKWARLRTIRLTLRARTRSDSSVRMATIGRLRPSIDCHFLLAFRCPLCLLWLVPRVLTRYLLLCMKISSPILLKINPLSTTPLVAPHGRNTRDHHHRPRDTKVKGNADQHDKSHGDGSRLFAGQGRIWRWQRAGRAVMALNRRQQRDSRIALGYCAPGH